MSQTACQSANAAMQFHRADGKDSRLYKRIRKFRLLAIVVLAAVAFLSVTHSGLQYTMQQLLVHQAQSTGMDWAHQIEAQMPSLSNIKGTRFSPDPEKFTELANGILAVGNIYQIDIINPNCYCDISFGSYSAKQSLHKDGPKIPVTHHHYGPLGKSHLSGISNVARQPAKRAIHHVFTGVRDHKAMHLGEPGQLNWPVDREFTYDVATSLRHDILIKKTDDTNQPSIFAEVYHPVSVDGNLSYILRVLVDLEEENALFIKTLYGGTGFIFLILVAAFGYPAGKYLQISAKQRAFNSRARHLATHDVMTDICNRNAFQEVAPNILKRCDEEGTNAILIQFDANNFKEINDYYGHQIGDKLLYEFARVLKQNVPPNGHAARLGGDEFAMIVGGLDLDDCNLEQLINLPHLFKASSKNNGEIISMNMSAGIARYPQDGDCFEELMRNCDLALYVAKTNPEVSCCEFSPQIGIDFRDRLNLRDEFRNAIKESAIEPYYQPLVNMHSGEVEGFEALARWNHPERGILSPAAFEELLTDFELGGALGSLMLKKIALDMKDWKAMGIPFKSVALNVGEGDLMRPGFSQNVIDQLKRNGLRSNCLAIEITERCMFGSNKEEFIHQLEELRAAGCKVSLDDFGTGYSSVTQIKELPCSALKIDKSFVKKVVDDKADQAIIQALLNLGNELDFKLVLEGVETKEQFEFLRDQGCHLAQGYLYSKPVRADDVPSLIERINGQCAHSAQQSMAA